ncbi:uncharacterized protein L203_104351 [Cryptococcus depauperatus CBS 7841]|uniref:Uncharacterized protein n=1 Tax=Cryptococcus depauperatus CBS 7841 TaxID=1295531 RepID=A0AAJ8JVB6_9TREE
MVDLGPPVGSRIPGQTTYTGSTNQEQPGFNYGVGAEHASGGIPKNNLGTDASHTPIADKFTGKDEGLGTTDSKLDNPLDRYSAGTADVGRLGHHEQEAVAGRYASGGTADALTGSTTATGVGHHGANVEPFAGHRNAALAATAGGAGALAGEELGRNRREAGLADTAGSNVANSSNPAPHSGLSGGTGGQDSFENSARSHGDGGATGAGAAPAGDGKYGRGTEASSGQPLSDPKTLDTGGPHSLVFDAGQGKYVHRRELEGDIGKHL